MITLRRLCLTGLLLATPALALAQTSEPITSNGDAVTRVNRNRHTVAIIELSGTWTGTVTFQVQGSTWSAISCVVVSDGTTRASTATANGKWRCDIGGASAVRAIATAAWTGQADTYIGFAGS
jgi:hypothetical protein